jgi:inner membrane protein
MDSLTHITLGACVGEIILGKQLVKRALVWGIIAQNLPDIDSAASLFTSADKAFLIHRGITHSIFFAIVIGMCLAFIAKKNHYKIYIPFATLAFFFCFQLALHDLLDACNSYGTGLLEPFSHHRFSINLLYVADPLFTIGLLIATLCLIFKPGSNRHRSGWAWIAIGISVAYLGFAGFNKINIDGIVKSSLRDQSLHTGNYFSTPAPLNCMLWYIVADADSGYYTTYSSIWDSRDQPVTYQFHPKNYSLLKDPVDQQTVQNLITFADNYYTVTQAGNSLYFNILRFEQVQGWQNSRAPFAFSYPLSKTGDQSMLLQKGRLTGWNKNSIKLYLKRIAGRQTADNY